MARALADAKVLDRPVSDVMQPPFPVIEPDAPVDRVTTLLSRETPAALVRQDGTLRRDRDAPRRAAARGRDKVAPRSARAL